MSFATKLSFIEEINGTKRDIMKYPKTDGGKISLPGVMKVVRIEGIPTVFPIDADVSGEDLLRVVYNNGPVDNAFSETFDQLRERVESEWVALPKLYDPISAPLQQKIAEWLSLNKSKFE